MKIKDICQEVALEYNLPTDLVLNTYIGYCKSIKNKMTLYDLKTMDSIEGLLVNINMPSLGKLYCSVKNFNNKKLYYAKYHKD